MKRILMCNEFSGFFSGYSIYGRELLQRLHSTGKYEIAELACYAHPEKHKHLIDNTPWKVYPILPTNQEELNNYKSSPLNQFGAFKFEQVCLDFRPHIVFDIRDEWMFEYQNRSPFRKCFKHVIMPTVDSEPQTEQWLSTFSNSDFIFNYTDWGYELLKKNGFNNLLGSAPPSANKHFTFIEDAKSKLGIDKNVKIIGTVMRNQKRKLYPNLFKAFRQFLDETKQNDIFLYCHTGYPDVGWDIPYLIKDYNVGNRVLMTYLCKNCKLAFPMLFMDAYTPCPKCRSLAHLTKPDDGVNDEILALILNSFDVYIQYANSEGFGMPQVEAAACHVPVMSVDYSAMSDVVRKLNGIPLKVLDYIIEPESMCKRAMPDDSFLVEKLKWFFNLQEEVRQQMRANSRKGFEQHYNWDKTAEKWMNCFDSIEEHNLWNQPKVMRQPAKTMANIASIKDFTRWLITDVLCEPDKLNTYMEMRMIRDLTYGQTNPGIGGHYFTENSINSGRDTVRRFTKQQAYEHFVAIANNRNYWESLR